MSNIIKTISELYIIDTEMPHKIKYDLKGHDRSHKALLAKFFQANSFINFDEKGVFQFEEPVPFSILE